MQVDPLKPELKPPGTKCLKLNCVAPVSSFAFKFNLRRYREKRKNRTFNTIRYECRKAGGSFRTSIRPKLNRRTDAARLPVSMTV